MIQFDVRDLKVFVQFSCTYCNAKFERRGVHVIQGRPEDANYLTCVCQPASTFAARFARRDGTVNNSFYVKVSYCITL